MSPSAVVSVHEPFAWWMGPLLLVTVVGALAPAAPGVAQTPPPPPPLCDPAWLAPGAITSRALAVPTPSFPASRCLGVHVGALEIGAPTVISEATSCEVAVLHRREIRRAELCGNDVHFEPIVEVGVVVLRRRGARWTRIASGRIDAVVSGLDALSTRDTDGDGHAELVLDGRLVLAIERRRVVVLRTISR